MGVVRALMEWLFPDNGPGNGKVRSTRMQNPIGAPVDHAKLKVRQDAHLRELVARDEEAAAEQLVQQRAADHRQRASAQRLRVAPRRYGARRRGPPDAGAAAVSREEADRRHKGDTPVAGTPVADDQVLGEEDFVQPRRRDYTRPLIVVSVLAIVLFLVFVVIIPLFVRPSSGIQGQANVNPTAAGVAESTPTPAWTSQVLVSNPEMTAEEQQACIAFPGGDPNRVDANYPETIANAGGRPVAEVAAGILMHKVFAFEAHGACISGSTLGLQLVKTEGFGPDNLPVAVTGQDQVDSSLSTMVQVDTSTVFHAHAEIPIPDDAPGTILRAVYFLADAAGNRLSPNVSVNLKVVAPQ